MSFYCFLRSLINIYPLYIGLSILIFFLTSRVIELTKILRYLNSELNALTNPTINTTLEISSIITYILGIVFILIIDLKFISNE